MKDGLPQFLALDWNGTVVPWFGEPAFPRAMAFIQHLAESGVHICVVSHATQSQIEGDVERLPMAADEVIGCRDKGRVFMQLQEQWDRGLAIGDTAMDLRAALEAGIPFVQARLEGQSLLPQCHGAIEDWGEAEAILQSMASIYSAY